MAKLETIDPLPERAWIKSILLYTLFAAPIIAMSAYLFHIQYTEYPIFWLLPAALTALVWAIMAFEAYTFR